MPTRRWLPWFLPLLSACTVNIPAGPGPSDTAPAQADPAPPREAPPERARPGPAARVPPYVVERLDQLAFTVGLADLDVEVPCVDRDRDVCVRSALDRAFHRLDRLAAGQAEGPVRLLLLGDSHIAADYIAKTTRARLQSVFGDAGRGYVHADQREGYGGRRRAGQVGFVRKRMIDPGQGRGRYGISGHALVATKLGGALEYGIEPGDRRVTLYLDAHPDGAELSVRADGATLGVASGVADPALTRAVGFDLPASAKALRVVATGPGASLLGADFTSGSQGLLLDAVGPVGADATTYIEADGKSFDSHLAALDPALIMIMLGGNDALRVRKGQATMEETRARFDRLIEQMSRAVPGADCLVMGPMDAGEKVKGAIRSKTLVGETRDMLREIAAAHGCAFWDLYAVMGGEGSIIRWSKAGIMNADLIHPRAKAGELIGHFFGEALLRAYVELPPP